MDSVSTAFELMRLELEVESERLNEAGASAFRLSDYETAEEQIRQGRSLKEFCERVSRLEDEWRERFALSDTVERVSDAPAAQTEAARTILAHSKSSKTSLLVRFSDGTIIAERTAAETLAKSIERVGFDRVEPLRILVNGENIVSKVSSSKYNDTKIGDRYIKTHSSTTQKVKNLRRISDALDLGLEVSIVE